MAQLAFIKIENKSLVKLSPTDFTRATAKSLVHAGLCRNLTHCPVAYRLNGELLRGLGVALNPYNVEILKRNLNAARRALGGALSTEITLMSTCLCSNEYTHLLV